MCLVQGRQAHRATRRLCAAQRLSARRSPADGVPACAWASMWTISASRTSGSAASNRTIVLSVAPRSSSIVSADRRINCVSLSAASARQFAALAEDGDRVAVRRGSVRTLEPHADQTRRNGRLGSSERRISGSSQNLGPTVCGTLLGAPYLVTAPLSGRQWEREWTSNSLVDHLAVGLGDARHQRISRCPGCACEGRARVSIISTNSLMRSQGRP